MIVQGKSFGRKRIDITLNQRVINKLKDLKKQKTGKPISQIVEEAVQQVNFKGIQKRRL